MRAVYASARQQGLKDEMLAALPSFEQSALFSQREKAALKFAEVLASDHRNTSDELFVRLREHFSESEILQLGWRIAMFIGYGRLSFALGLQDVGRLCFLPEKHSEMRQATK
jgi:alkylhydroperoxidase family enzyme